jgi:nicotinamidase-related amidase
MSGSAVLVVVDVQNGFITEHSRPVVPVIVDLVSRWQEAGGDTVFTRYLNYPGSPYERLINWTALQGPPATNIIDELAACVSRASAVVDKTIYTLFTEEGAALVRSRGWTDLYICGIDTESCVLKTAVDAFERDLTPWVLADACASHSGSGPHDAGLLVASRFIGKGQVITTSEARFPSLAANENVVADQPRRRGGSSSPVASVTAARPGSVPG